MEQHSGPKRKTALLLLIYYLLEDPDDQTEMVNDARRHLEDQSKRFARSPHDEAEATSSDTW